MASLSTHFEIYGDAPDVLAEFYSSLFGWRIERAPGVDYWRIHLDGGANAGLRGGGIAHPPAFAPGGWLPFVEVESLDAVLVQAPGLGGRLVQERRAVPKTAWYAVISDPGGNHLAVWEQDGTAMPLPEPN